MCGGDASFKMTLDESLLVRHKDAAVSSYCFVAYGDEIEEILCRRYGREGLCLKVFPADWDRLEDVTWGRVPLEETVVIQNLFALHGIAPRVYDVLWLNGKQAAQVTRFLKPESLDRDVGRFQELMAEYGIEYVKNYDVLGKHNWIAGKMVDFSGLRFANRNDYIMDLRGRAYTRRGKNINTAYQSVPQLGIRGTRNTKHRTEMMRLDDVDFQDANVLDIGCNLGAFCREAKDRGARRVVGVDRREIPGLATEVCNLTGHWDIDFVNVPLAESAPNKANIVEAGGFEGYDVVFCMAVQNYFGGYADWIASLCEGILYLEGHGGEDRSRYQAVLERDFAVVEFLDTTTDNYTRPLFRCWK